MWEYRAIATTLISEPTSRSCDIEYAALNVIKASAAYYYSLGIIEHASLVRYGCLVITRRSECCLLHQAMALDRDELQYFRPWRMFQNCSQNKTAEIREKPAGCAQ